MRSPCRPLLIRSLLARTLDIGWLLSTAFLASPSLALQEPVAAQPGLAVGSRAPSFTLPGQDGLPVKLESLLRQGPVALVFYRSADWCMYCKLQLVQLQRNLPEIEASGGRIVGISYDSVEDLRAFAERSSITFPLLSDAGSRVIDAYAFRSHEADAPGFAYHGTFLIDQDGIIRDKLFQVSYRERAAVENLVEALRRAGQPAAAKPSKAAEVAASDAPTPRECCVAPPLRRAGPGERRLDRRCRPLPAVPGGSRP